MPHDEIFSELHTMIRDLVPEYDGDILPESTFDELGVDSLARVDLFVGAEHTFRIEIPDEQLSKLGTVQELTDFIKAARDSQPAST
jgi:acyl carrier protein